MSGAEDFVEGEIVEEREEGEEEFWVAAIFMLSIFISICFRVLISCSICNLADFNSSFILSNLISPNTALSEEMLIKN